MRWEFSSVGLIVTLVMANETDFQVDVSNFFLLNEVFNSYFPSSFRFLGVYKIKNRHRLFEMLLTTKYMPCNIPNYCTCNLIHKYCHAVCKRMLVLRLNGTKRIIPSESKNCSLTWQPNDARKGEWEREKIVIVWIIKATAIKCLSSGYNFLVWTRSFPFCSCFAPCFLERLFILMSNQMASAVCVVFVMQSPIEL